MKNKFVDIKAFLFKQITIWMIIFIILLSAVGDAQAKNISNYKQMSEEEKFIEIREQVTHSALDVLNYKASDAYKMLAQASKDFQKIYFLVQKTDEVDKVINKVANGLDEIASAYEEVANFSSEIILHRNEEFSQLLNYAQETLQTENELKGKITEIESNNRLIQKKLVSINDLDEIELKKIEVSLKGNESVINSLQAQCIIWNKFYQTQKKMLSSIDLSSKKVDLLLHILDVNADVYREAANVARLRHSAKSALDSLNTLIDIQDIVVDLKNSWVEVNDIVTEISNAEFAVNIE